MKQEYIESFLEIVKTLNITRASENLHISQSALSNRLKMMEEELGMQLLMRSKGNRTIELTKYGENFVNIAEQWISLYDETEKLKKNCKMSLIVGAGDSLHSSVLFPIYHQISLNEKAIALKIKMHNSLELYKFIENRDIDIALVSFSRDIKNVVVKPFFQQKMCIIYNCADMDISEIDTPKKLDPCKEIYLNWGKEFELWHDKWTGNKLCPLVETDSISTLINYMNYPNNWAIVPLCTYLALLSYNQNIKICQFDEITLPERICYLIKNLYIPQSHAKGVEIFENYLIEHVNKDDSLSIIKHKENLPE